MYNKSQIIKLIKNDLNNNDYLMIKASNATGFNEIVKFKRIYSLALSFLLNFVDTFAFKMYLNI